MEETLMQNLEGDRDNSAEELRDNDELVTFNVSGSIFVTFSSTLNNFPTSIFGTKDKRERLLRTKDGAIFLNRSPKAFKRVLTFFQTGYLECPEKMNQSIFLDDIQFYNLEKEAIESKIIGFSIEKPEMPKPRLRAMLWSFLEYPDSSVAARIFSLLSILVIVVSIVVFCWETLPSYRRKIKETSEGESALSFATPFDKIELFCIIWFIFELLARFLLCPNKAKFIRSCLNIIDLVAILPFLVSTLGRYEGQVSIYFLRAIRLVRVFRVFKLSRHSVEMKILAIAVKDSTRELGVLVFFILLGVLLFSSAVYYAEQSSPSSVIDSIPGAFWWSIVTMTTVGYGDVVPVTPIGRLVGAVCGMSGILVIALPIPIIVNNFTRQYQRLRPVSTYFEMVRIRNSANKLPVTGLFTLHQLREEQGTRIRQCTGSDPCEGLSEHASIPYQDGIPSDSQIANHPDRYDCSFGRAAQTTDQNSLDAPETAPGTNADPVSDNV